jgi:RsiW-degrading membrane proteinase PrsW (M82 family)
MTSHPFTQPMPLPSRPAHTWWRVLLVGLALYFLGIAILIITGNPNLFPTVVMLGNFMVPVSYVTFFYERQHLSRLTLPEIARGFIYGGVLGVFAASLLEPLFIRHLDFITAFGVGLIEEFAKILGVLVVARHRRHDSELDGLLLGAAAGMGFAALESTGYAFTAFLRSGGSLSLIVGITLLRGFLSPVGHGTWTAIFASVLFRESGPGRFHLNRQVVMAYLTVSILHGLWDGLPGLITAFIPQGPDVLIGEAIVAFTGLVILRWRWREAKRLEQARAVAAQVVAPAS